MTVKPLFKFFRDVLRSTRGLQVGGSHFRLPIGLHLTLEEPWMCQVIAILLPHTQGAFLDVGVNLGQTLLCLRAADRNRCYVGFEPNSSCNAAVQQLIELNGIVHTTLIPAACSVEYGVQRLYHYQDSRYDSSASLVPQFRPTMDVRRETFVVTVPALATLKDLDIGQLGLVKIDVEGFEADVLEALEPQLSVDRPIILVEILPVRDGRTRQEAANRITALLDRLGYRAHRIVKNQCNEFEAFTAPVTLATHAEVIDSDHLLVPEGFHHRNLHHNGEGRIHRPDTAASNSAIAHENSLNE